MGAPYVAKTVKKNGILSSWKLAWRVAALALLIGTGLVCTARPLPLDGTMSETWGFETEVPSLLCRLEDGAEGSAVRDELRSRSGKASVRIEKRGGLGWIRVVVGGPIEVKAGRQYTFRGWFSADDAPLGSLLLFRVSGARDGNLSYDSIDRSYGYCSQSLIPNSRPGEWRKRVVRFQPQKDQKVYLHVALLGNPATVWLDDLEFTDMPWTQVNNTGESTPRFSEEEVRANLALATNAVVQIRSESERWCFELEGNIIAPSMYVEQPYRQSDRVRLYEHFGKAGIPLATVTVVLSQSRLEAIENRPIMIGCREYDWELLEQDLLRALRRNPEARLILDLGLTGLYPGWADKHPDDIWMNVERQKGYGWWGNLEGFTSDLEATRCGDTKKRHLWYYPSYHSEAWLSECKQAVEDVVHHVMGTPFGKRIVGFKISGGHDGQFQVHVEDFSPVAISAFRDWLEQRYGTIEALNKAWKSKHAGFEALVPPQPATADFEALPPISSPGVIPDYRLFREDRSWHIKDALAGAAKAAAGKPTVAVAYAECQNGYQLDHLASQRNLDAAALAGYYPMRLPGYPLGFKPSATVREAGKGSILELDTRTYASGRQIDEVYEMWISQAWSPHAWVAIHRKMVGAALANGEGYWYYSMNRYFDDPFIMGEIAKVQRTATELMRRPVRHFRPDMCVVDAAANTYFPSATSDQSKPAPNFPVFRVMLESSGVPYDEHTLEAVLAHKELQNYRVYVFPRQFMVTAEQRRQIDALLKDRGQTLVWMYGSGYVTESGVDVLAMSNLIGITVATDGQRDREASLLIPNASPWVAGLLPRQDSGELALSVFTIRGRSSFTARAQQFWVDDAKATPLARYVGSAKVSMAMRTYPEWTSIYIAPVFGMGNDLFHRIATESGAFVAAAPGQSIQMNGNFASIHGLRSERMVLRLPPGATRVIDPDTRRVLADGVAEYLFWIDVGETVWFWFE